MGSGVHLLHSRVSERISWKVGLIYPVLYKSESFYFNVLSNFHEEGVSK